jgi:cyclic pyranopterin phosphate synthase
MDDDLWNIDGTKMHLHPARVAQWLEAGDDWEKAKKVYPIYYEITTSAACNHRCTFCSVDAIGYPAILIDETVICDRMAEAKRLGVKSVMFAGTGEPLVHKRIDRIHTGAVTSGLDTAFTTNGVLLDRLESINYASWVKVSLNAGSPETYAAVHQTDIKDWDKVWAGIRNAVKRKGNCTLGVQCVVLPENVYEMRALASMCADAGVDYLVLKPYSQGTFSITKKYEGVDYQKMRNYLEGVREFSTDKFKVIYRANAIGNEIKKQHGFSKCLATPFTWVYSMADGRVFTCSAHLMDESFCIGNLNDQSFQDIWEGPERKRQWEQMKTFDIRKCRLSCRMAQVNRYLDQFGKTPHANFI